ncbi:protein ALP1-like [Monomorium pharaonis]|uniref:protein ALP1-like n=1 Tax=Monomorium pharaonis TaxID=307658 RepID=UPI00063FBC27|nr:protein ALP1-like [Monomorium pharaonis]
MEEYITATVRAEIKRRRAAVVIAAMHLIQQKKKVCKKKKYWVAPIFKNRSRHSSFFASTPKLILEDIQFHNFRMTATQLEELLGIVGSKLQKQDVSITPAERLALTLRYLASGDSMTSMSYQYLVEVPTVSNIIHDTCAALWDCLNPIVLPNKLQEKDWLDIANNFEIKCNFAHCIGAIDGKRVIIQCPNNDRSTYFNDKYSHSIVLMAICDANYIIRFVDIGAYGRRSDGSIFRDSAIGQAFDEGQMGIPQPTVVREGGSVLPYCLVGDEAFPLKSYLLRPYPGRDGLIPKQSIYNYRLSRARRMIENTFGILASQWRIYRKPIIANPKNAKIMISATICLHNWLCRQDSNIYVPPTLIDIDEPNSFTPGSWRIIMEDGCAFRNISNCGSNMSAKQCVDIRNKFCDYFNNEGVVNWQNNKI